MRINNKAISWELKKIKLNQNRVSLKKSKYKIIIRYCFKNEIKFLILHQIRIMPNFTYF